MLETIGLKLDSEQVTVEGQHIRFYQITAASFDELRTLAAQRLATLQAKRDEEYGGALNLKTAKAPVFKGDGSFKIAVPLPGETGEGFTNYASAAVLMANLNAIGAIGKGYQA